MFEQTLKDRGPRSTVSRTERAFVGAGIGLLFALALLVLTGLSVAAGDGSYLPAVLLFGFHPVLGFVVWPLAGLLAGLQPRRSASIAGMLTLAVGIAGAVTAAVLRGDELDVTNLNRVNVFTAVACLLYAAGQIALWLWFLASTKPGPDAEAP